MRSWSPSVLLTDFLLPMRLQVVSQVMPSKQLIEAAELHSPLGLEGDCGSTILSRAELEGRPLVSV